ncbi:MAG: hypothetical protein R3336_10635, partial [Phycisphaeraceae bacterium]|nr:hypothetical protein [Phycisphaeraceae bacterium]
SLYASSGEILTEEEQAERQLEARIRQRLERQLGEEKVSGGSLPQRRPYNQIKPGNPINIRVIDPDRSVTTQPDEVAVRVSTTSGDAIEQFILKETGPLTGVFEGAVPTASGDAVAYASDSKEGSRPNFVISAGDHPPWVGLPDSRRPKVFSVDLNDNVTVSQLTVVADVPGRKFKSFAVQTSMNGRSFDTVGSWPQALEPWDGSPQVQLVAYEGRGKPPQSPSVMRGYIENDYLKHSIPRAEAAVDNMAAGWDPNLGGLAGKANVDYRGHFVARFRAAFYQPERGTRTFDLEAEGRGDCTFVLALNGKTGEQPHRVEQVLNKGVHTVEILISGHRHDRPKFKLRTNTAEPP